MIRSLKSISAAAMLLVTSLVFTSCEGAFDDIFGEWSRPGTVTSIPSTRPSPGAATILPWLLSMLQVGFMP